LSGDKRSPSAPAPGKALAFIETTYRRLEPGCAVRGAAERVTGELDWRTTGELHKAAIVSGKLLRVKILPQ
jgi:hypothetical protein